MDFNKAEKISKALGDPYRLQIMEIIRKQQDWVQCTAIIEQFDLAQSTVSHHLKLLVDADLLFSSKDGRTTRFTVNKEELTAYINYLSQFSK